MCIRDSNEPGARTSVQNLANIIYGRINIRGFVVTDFLHLRDDFRRDMVQWLREGRIKYQETILDGIENAPKALIGLLNGLNTVSYTHLDVYKRQAESS